MRFELTNPCGLPVFKTGAIDHSAKLPVRASVFVIVGIQMKRAGIVTANQHFAEALSFAERLHHGKQPLPVSWYILPHASFLRFYFSFCFPVHGGQGV